MSSGKLLPFQLASYLSENIGWLLTLCFVGMTFIPRSFDETLFVDGLAYASISRNMAAGLGSFWQPHFADSFWLTYNDRCSFFCEHPPLMFGIQSVLFRVFGDLPIVENLYNAMILVAAIFLIVRFWKALFSDHPQLRSFSWLPVLFWYSLGSFGGASRITCWTAQWPYFVWLPAISNCWLFQLPPEICIGGFPP